MSPLEIQFEDLKLKYPQATLQRNPDGSAIISIPNIPLKPAGQWNNEATTVRFVAPVGYPAAKPDCFWTDADVRLRNGNIPKNTGQQPLAHSSVPTLWFSWHAASWNVNSDNLRTYLRVIEDRLARAE